MLYILTVGPHMGKENEYIRFEWDDSKKYSKELFDYFSKMTSYELDSIDEIHYGIEGVTTAMNLNYGSICVKNGKWCLIMHGNCKGSFTFDSSDKLL